MFVFAAHYYPHFSNPISALPTSNIILLGLHRMVTGEVTHFLLVALRYLRGNVTCLGNTTHHHQRGLRWTRAVTNTAVILLSTAK